MSHGGLKLVLAGPVGSGKTTALRSLADSEPVSTEMPLLDGAMGDKTTTTVALDFATVMLEDGTPLQMFGLPGQEHFSHMRSIILNGALGVVLLLSGDAPDVAADCVHWLSVIRDIDQEMPLVIGITKTDVSPHFRMDRIRKAVRDNPIPAFTIDARDREQTRQLVRALLLTMG